MVAEKTEAGGHAAGSLRVRLLGRFLCLMRWRCPVSRCLAIALSEGGGL